MSDPRLIVWGWAALEADLWRFYRIDLNDACFNDRVTWRRFRALIRGLPEDSAWQAFLRDRRGRSLATYTQPTV